MEVVNMCENENGVLENLFESREKNLCELTENNDSYDKLFAIIKDLSNNSEKLEEVRNSLDSYIDKINIIGAYENEKFYKIRLFRCNKLNFRM